MKPDIWVRLEEATRLLNSKQVVGLPTETVYGLAARVDFSEAIKKIFEVKSRPFFDPLIVHVSDQKMAKRYASTWDKDCETLAKTFWPGPLSIIVPKSELVSDLITAGLPKVALRCPDQPYFRRVIRNLDCGLAAPSANRFGKTSPTQAHHVTEELGSSIFVLDGGVCQVGIESTVVSVSTKIEIHRPGLISKEDLAKALPHKEIIFGSDEAAPGQLASHYQPEKKLLILKADEAVNQETAYEIKLNSDPKIAARELYSQLRSGSQTKKEFIYIRWREEFSSENWRAIRDRLRRAATQAPEFV